ncbi:hypothetical protein SCP_0311890 [Sparassis crispa]|uniref:Uncharacterized protein n=1 Tax=Sparassis crispa TaxID=139825 RepID=A0A401GH07_9APHY|nr:hypothetical protein SCP_0311890 [Sparassis crispa]GBE81460.1 hypothetical protein SCP_0311890 [Sparassis crispa]
MGRAAIAVGKEVHRRDQVDELEALHPSRIAPASGDTKVCKAEIPRIRKDMRDFRPQREWMQDMWISRSRDFADASHLMQSMAKLGVDSFDCCAMGEN